MTPPGGEVRYGTAGWAFDDWYGTFYPRSPRDDGPGSLFTGVPDAAPDPDVARARAQPLAYYARFFDTVEVNASFYRTPARRTTAAWARLTRRREGPPFLFSFKLPGLFSHDGDLDRREVSAFADALAPVREEGRLAAVLAQFPHRFSCTAPARERLARIRDAFPDLPLAVEVRHRSWDDDAPRAFLAELGAALACIDQPQREDTLPAREDVLVPDLAYVRLHGRNASAWFDPRAGRDARYDYLYDPTEVVEWGRRIEALATRARRVLVIANNHFRGQAPANALELRRLREGQVPAPRALRAAYPRLAGEGAER